MAAGRASGRASGTRREQRQTEGNEPLTHAAPQSTHFVGAELHRRGGETMSQIDAASMVAMPR